MEGKIWNLFSKVYVKKFGGMEIVYRFEIRYDVEFFVLFDVIFFKKICDYLDMLLLDLNIWLGNVMIIV